MKNLSQYITLLFGVLLLASGCAKAPVVLEFDDSYTRGRGARSCDRGTRNRPRHREGCGRGPRWDQLFGTFMLAEREITFFKHLVNHKRIGFSF